MRKFYKLYRVEEKREGFFRLEFVHSVQALDVTDAERAFRDSPANLMEPNKEYLIILVG